MECSRQAKGSAGTLGTVHHVDFGRNDRGWNADVVDSEPDMVTARKIILFLSSHPGQVYSTAEIADAIHTELAVVNMNLAYIITCDLSNSIMRAGDRYVWRKIVTKA